MKKCVFCQKNHRDFILENNLSAAFFDFAPVSLGHTLIIPKRHVEQIWQLNSTELNSLWELIEQTKQYLDRQYHPDGYNIGINAGRAAGQSVMHCHVHLIPRYMGKGPSVPGVEHLIPLER
ncbi:HIT family protein [Paucilactobacillus kaifaensis]|uniref:HIT family protein n=1 Tax=Paucilactobacillus kaifaensis TaxID=2559921 RepID=UPI0010F7FBCA|nr:HIT domain-containing protein [Paucilactobacillus kaifaensis]